MNLTCLQLTNELFYYTILLSIEIMFVDMYKYLLGAIVCTSPRKA